MRAGERVIEQLVRGEYPDPDAPLNPDDSSRPPLVIPIRAVAVRDTLDGHEVDLVRSLEAGDSFAVVSDTDTHAILGARVERALGSAFTVHGVVMPAGQHPDEDALARLDRAIPAGADALIAIGAGTINDLCKKAAASRGRPYAVFGTAPSVNGYASPTSSITVGGLKSSLSAAPPIGVFMDLGVLAGAPRRMIQAGLGECVCRPTAQVDWLLAHMLKGEPYIESPFAITRVDEDELLASADALVAGDLEAMGLLARSLVLAGIGMTIAGGSKSISQGEHLISHYLDMTRPDDVRGPLHGEQVGACAVVMASLQQRVLEGDRPPVVHATRVTEADVLAHWGADLGALCWREFSPKRLTDETAAAINERIAGAWDAIRARLGAAGRPADEIARALERADAPTDAAGLAIDGATFANACNHAREIRARYTFLDLAGDADIAVL